jgi:FixJ family two-component response regulator
MAEAHPIVMVVDDDDSFRRSLARLLLSHGLEAWLFESAEALAGCGAFPEYGCMVLDVRMPGLDGLALQEKLARGGFDLPIIFLTGHGDIPMSVRAMKHGASDFLTKPVDEAVLMGAIHKALADQSHAGGIRARVKSLTHREHEVLCHVIAGELNKQIAARLDITEKTVKVHRARAMEKMGVGSLAELVRVCAVAGVDPADKP